MCHTTLGEYPPFAPTSGLSPTVWKTPVAVPLAALLGNTGLGAVWGQAMAYAGLSPFAFYLPKKQRWADNLGSFVRTNDLMCEDAREYSK
jgi:hypothetical protein